METLEQYIFYTILKDKNDEGKAISYGTKRVCAYDHEEYFAAFLGIDPLAFSDVEKSIDWYETCLNIAADGNVMIMDEASMPKKNGEKTYTVLLPSSPNHSQMEELKVYLPQLREIVSEVRVCDEFSDDFSSGEIELLEKYIDFHNEQLKETDCHKQKVKIEKNKKKN